MAVRLEEVVSNYQTNRKSNDNLADDLHDNIEIFISSKRLEGYSDLTLYDYQTELSLFADQMKKSTVQISTPDIRNYLSKIKQEKEVMASTLGKKLYVLKSFFSFLVQEEILLRDPTKKIKAPKLPKRLPKALSVEELEMVRESCKTLRQKALIEVMYSTGARLSEVSNMRIKDLNKPNMTITVIGKGDKERVTFLSYKSLFHLNKYLKSRADDCDYLFATQNKPIRQMKNCSIQREVDKIEKLSGLTKKLTPHVFRHTLASTMVNNGADLVDIQQILGHSNPSTSLVYINVSEERKQSAHKRFHVQ
ncbi:hypothetical protein B1B05_01305 [Domibacillus enclensis]|nr:hypothetical protein B1B05_01305 [Domibacillus enclensis]